MSITWTEDAESRQNLGMSGIIQQNTAVFSASDYVKGGYPVYASYFGLSHIRSLIPCGYAQSGPGTPASVEWKYIKPAVSGPSATNPGFLIALEPGASNSTLVEVSASTNFSVGNLDCLAYGY
jgi:hypothetical protein